MQILNKLLLNYSHMRTKFIAYFHSDWLNYNTSFVVSCNCACSNMVFPHMCLFKWKLQIS